MLTALENKPEELLTLGKLISRFPHTPDAAAAAEEAEVLLAEVYEAGRAGGYAIGDWVDVHLQLLPYFRFSPSFANHAETLADYMLNLGATDLATSEYRRAIRLIHGRSPEPAQEDTAQIFRINLKLAQAQYRSGLSTDARKTLEMMEMSEAGGFAEAYAQTLALVLADLDDRPALLQTELEAPTPGNLRTMAAALAEEGRWDQSRDVLRQFWYSHPDDFGVQDATHLLIAASRLDDTVTRDSVIRLFPSLSEDKSLINLAKSLKMAEPELLPLRQDQAAARLEKLEDAFESIKNSRIYSSTPSE